VYLGRWWGGSDPTEVDALDAIGIGGAKYRTYIVEATHIVEHHDEGHLMGLAVVGHVHTIELEDIELLHL
jgi:hypothetical protein